MTDSKPTTTPKRPDEPDDRPRAARHILVAAVTIAIVAIGALLVQQSDDDDSVQTTDADAIDQAIVDAVLNDYTQSWEQWLTSVRNPEDPSPFVEHWAVGDAAALHEQLLADLAARHQTIDGHYEPDATVLAIDDNTATVLDCGLESLSVLDDDGAIETTEAQAVRYRVELVNEHDDASGRWKVATVSIATADCDAT